MNSKEPLIISLDFGTNAIKVGIFTIDGELLHLETREQDLIFIGNERVEQNPQVTWNLVTKAVRESMVDHDPSLVKAIVLSVQRGTVVPLDAFGEPITNLVVWMDRRGFPQTKYLTDKIGDELYYKIAGHPISYIAGVSKLLWFQNDTELWKDIRVLATPQTLFLKWLGCEELVCDLSSGTYHFPFDIKHKVWSKEIAKQLGFPLEKLPTLVTAIDVIGELSKRAAKDLDLIQGIPIVAGGGDGQCAGIGCGVIDPGICMINIGTGAGVQTYLRSPTIDPNQVLNCAAHVDPNAWEMEGHTQASGAAFQWFRDEFGDLEMIMQKRSRIDAFDLLIKQAIETPPGSDGILFIPTFNGSTAPIMSQDSKAALIGLTLSHKKEHIIRALLEGISFEIRWLLDAIVEAGVGIDEIRLVGGGAKNSHWNQIHADVFNRPIRLVQITDAALVGAAMCGAVAIGAFSNFKEASTKFVHIKDTVDPQRDNFNIYQDSYEKYKRTFISLCKNGIFDDLSE